MLTKVRACIYALRLPNLIDKDALVQDIWIKAWQNKKPLASLYIRHRAINAIRRLRKETSETLIFLESPEPRAIPSEEVERLMNSSGLSPDEVLVIYNYYYVELSFGAIKDKVGKAHSWVERVYHSALEKLKRQARVLDLDEDLGGDE